jgi:outer membrane lipoprotein SlyB
MEAVPNKRLHPLLTVAAISLTVFSAVGVAALTGVLPHSIGSSKEAAPAALAAAPLVAAPDIAASTAVSSPAPAEKPAAEVAPMPPAAAKSTPAPRPAHKKIAKTAPKPVQIAEAPQAQAAPIPPPPPAPMAAAKPVPAGILGVVESVREIKQAQKTNGSGPILGGIAGAVGGHQIGSGNGNTLATILGAVGGAVAGTAVERNVRATTHWEINVRLDDGSTRTMNSDVQPFWHGGERVRFLDGKLQPA